MENAITNWNLVTSIERWLRVKQRHTTTLPIPELDSAISTTTGSVREENQDCAIAARFSIIPGGRPISLFVVCDGLGGMEDGAAIAQKSVAVLLDSFITSGKANLKDRLRDAVLAADRVIFGHYHQRGGTTIAVICRTAESSFALTAGDTRVYSLDTKPPLIQESIDDTIAGQLIRMPHLKLDVSQLGRFENQLSQFIGIGRGLEPHIFDLPPGEDVTYYIASDGAYNIGGALESILANASDTGLAAERITQISQWMGGRDNASIICIGPDKSRFLGASEQLTLELWSASSALNVLTTRQFSQADTKPEPTLPPNETPDLPKESRIRNAKGKRANDGSKARKQTRPILHIEFEDHPGQDRNQPSSVLDNLPNEPTDGADSSLSTEPQQSVTENEEKLDG